MKKIVQWGCATVAISLIGIIFFLSGYTTTRHIGEQYVTAPDGSEVRIYTSRDFVRQNGWLTSSTERDVMDLYSYYSPALAEKYTLVFINDGQHYPVPFKCNGSDCGGWIAGPQPLIGRDVKLCFVPRWSREARCATLRFAYHITVFPTWFDIMARQ